MAFSDIAGNLIQLLQSVGQSQPIQQRDAFQAAGPQGVLQLLQNQQENQRQATALQAQQAQHQQDRSSLTAYEQAQMDAEKASRATQEQRNLFQAVAQGARPAKEGDPGAMQVGGNWLIPPIPKVYKVEKDSPVGKDLGLTDDLEVGSDKYLEMAEKGLLLKDKAAQKQQFKDALAEQASGIASDINTRFQPNYYESLYGKGNIDPQMDRLRQSMLDRLKSAVLIDQNRGTTEAIQQVGKTLTDYQSPWEKNLTKQKEFDRESALRLMEARQKQSDLHPDPTPEEVAAGVNAYKTDGLQALTGLHTLNPKLATAVSREGAKQGLNPIKLTVEELNNSKNARIAMQQLQQASNLLDQPGMEQAIGPVASRWKAFMSGEVGAQSDPRVKALQDKVALARQVLGKVHYTARGSANITIQQALSHLVDAAKMDMPTLRTSIADLNTILSEYAETGVQSGGVAGGLGLPEAGNPLGLVPRR